MAQNIHKQPITIKPRNSLIAFLLSLFFPGLGQVYNGQPQKGIILFCLMLFLPLLFGTTRWVTSFYGLFTLVIIGIILFIYIIFDSIKNARQQQNYALKAYNTWYYHLLIGIGIYAVLMVYDVNTIVGMRAFRIPTISNNPTFQVGDLVMADMRAYHNARPDYGDIALFTMPDGQIYAFRVVGRPSDKIALINNIVSINNRLSKATFIKETTNNDMSNDDVLTNNNVPVMEFEEEFPNGYKHLIYRNKSPYDSTKANIKNIIVPSDCYYLLGDNRDNAADSRYEGAINIDRIKGKVVYSYFGQTTDRINIDFTNK